MSRVLSTAVAVLLLAAVGFVGWKLWTEWRAGTNKAGGRATEEGTAAALEAKARTDAKANRQRAAEECVKKHGEDWLACDDIRDDGRVGGG